MAIETLLNQEIRGGLSPHDKRGFFRASIPLPEYSPGFFETSPTMWAAAYDFEQKVVAGDRIAMGEWASLVLLHYCRKLRVVNFEETSLGDGGYDPDLWPVLKRTYPKASQADELKQLGVVITSDNYVIGGVYPSVIFFPGRGRDRWKGSEISEYLEGTVLSWKECRERLLEPEVENQFRGHLREIILSNLLPAQNPDTRSPLSQFCQSEFNLRVDTLALAPELSGDTKALESDPVQWPSLNETLTARDFLDRYPFVRDRTVTIDNQTSTHRTYYFVEGMPPAPNGWMTKPLGLAMPSPSQYELIDQRKVKVGFNKSDDTCDLNDNEEVVQLKNCFIKNPTYCGLPNEEYVPSINQHIHREINSGQGWHSPVKENGGIKNSIVVWLAPISKIFIEQFPELLNNPTDIKRVEAKTDNVVWRFKLPSRKRQPDETVLAETYEIEWETEPVASKTVANLGLAIWPPEANNQWCLYAAYGTAGTYIDDDKRTRKAERWLLVGEQGVTDNNLELDEVAGNPSANYVSILEGNGFSNMPKALFLLNKAGNEAGVAFLTPSSITGKAVADADLSIDFGTSNTSLASKRGDGRPEPLTFSLTPRLLWGKMQEYVDAATPGFVPFEWSAAEGVYPSVLLAKKTGWGSKEFSGVAGDLQVQHLWRAGIPALYKDEAVIKTLYQGGYEKTTWDKYDDMKWSDDPDERSARAIFLGRSLLYACAELFFKQYAKVRAVVCTYPLAFSPVQEKTFQEDSTTIANRIRKFCYTQPITQDKVLIVSESRAVASYREQEPNVQTLELFIDTGGGTTDLALRHHTEYLVLDSFKVAGSMFFNFAEKNLEKANRLRGAEKFRQHLGRLLQGKKPGEELDLPEKTKLKPFYSLLINRYNTEAFVEKERLILSQGMGEQIGGETEQTSYQRHRTQKFFKQIIAYALLQACAAAAEGNRALALDVDELRIDLTLGGNAWGLMMFGELERSKDRLEAMAKSILNLLRQSLESVLSVDEKQCLARLRIGDVSLLNQDKLSEAKTAVAVGALKAAGQNIAITQSAPYSGIHINGLKASKGKATGEIRWCDRWSRALLLQKTGQDDEGNLQGLTFDAPGNLNRAVHPAVSALTFLEEQPEETLSERHWININSQLNDAGRFQKAGRLIAPINYFLSYLYSSEEADTVLNSLAGSANNFETPSTAALR